MSPKFVICVFPYLIYVASATLDWNFWKGVSTKGFEFSHRPKLSFTELAATKSTQYRTLLSASPSVDEMFEENGKSETTSLSTSTTTSTTTTTTTTTTSTPATTTPAITTPATTTTTTPATTTTNTTTTPVTSTTEISSTSPPTLTDENEKPKEIRDVPSFQDDLPTNNSGMGSSIDSNNSFGKDDGGITDKPGTTPRNSNETVIPETAESPNLIKNDSRDDYGQPRPMNESEQLQNGKRELSNLDGPGNMSDTNSAEIFTPSDQTPDGSNQVNVTLPRNISSNATTGQPTIVQTTSGFKTGSTVSGSESINNSQMVLLINLLIFSITIIV